MLHYFNFYFECLTNKIYSITIIGTPKITYLFTVKQCTIVTIVVNSTTILN